MHGRIKAKIVVYLPYSTGKNALKSAILQYSTVRYENRIVNNETRWHIQVNSAKISLFTEVFTLDTIQNYLTQDDKVDGWVIL